MASKLVLSLAGLKMGSISFLSSASKSMGRKNGLSVNVSKPIAPIRRDRSFSSSELMACKQGIVTGGLVTGNCGSPLEIFAARASCVFPSKGR